MSTTVPAPPTNEPTTAPAAPAPDRARTVRDAVVSGGCALSGVLVTTGFALDPTRSAGTSSEELIAAVATDPGRFWGSMTLASFGLAMLALAGPAVVRLVPGRGRGLATAGALLTSFGAVSAAAAMYMYGAVVSASVESPIGTEAAVALQDHAEDAVATGLPFMLGFPAFLLGLVLCVAALARAPQVPKAVPAVLLAGLVGIVVLGDARPLLATASDVVLACALAVLGVLSWRRRAPRTIALPA